MLANDLSEVELPLSGGKSWKSENRKSCV